MARLAPAADLLRVALASNRAFGLIAGFFARFDSRIPPEVSALDHLDFEAKLQATAGHRAERCERRPSTPRAQTWAAPPSRGSWTRAAPGSPGGSTRTSLVCSGLAAAGGRPPAAPEAQRGLDLVDEIEAVYQR